MYWKLLTENNQKKDEILDFSLSRITFLSRVEKTFLYKNIENAEQLAQISRDDLSKLIQRNIRSIWNGVENLRLAKKELQICKSREIGFLRYDDAAYPAMLRDLANSPYMIFYRGNPDVFNGRSVSVVGTRRISAQGKEAARSFGKDAALDGVSVVSGLASGVDGYAHMGAVDAWFDAVDKGNNVNALGKTIAVLPCAIDTIFPACHKRLAENIISSGGILISEYAPGTEGGKWQFVQRNRIIAALSPATVVIEAPNGSGALITANFALEMGRDVIFHKSCLSENARKIEAIVKQNLEKDFAEKLISRSKLENCVDSFLQDGAPVVTDYVDYCKCLAEMPGIRSVRKVEQGDLFDNL